MNRKLFFLIFILTSLVLTACNWFGGEKRYIGNSPEQCASIRFACEPDEAYFSDDKGCGCQKTMGTKESSDKNYVSKDLKECSLLLFTCKEGLKPFTDEQGCGCEPGVRSDTDVPVPAPKLAMVDKVEVMVAESLPVQVTLVATGNLRNGCERIGAIEKSQDQRTVTIHTTTQGDQCTQALVPFSQRVKLDVGGWKKGDYTVTVNGIKADFTLSSDNTLPTSVDDSACSDDGKPVCAKIQVQCVKAPCDPVWETMSGSCEAKRRKALEVKQGAC